jgi:four helix bundle protein
MRLTQLAYQTTEGFPPAERFGLTLQVRGAAVSIACNIAEGAARKSSKEFGHFLSIALGSLAELDTQIEIAVLPGWLSESGELAGRRTKVAQVTTRLRQAVSRHVARGSPNTDHGSPNTDHGSR